MIEPVFHKWTRVFLHAPQQKDIMYILFVTIKIFIKALRIGFNSFNLSILYKGCCKFERFRLALFKNRR